jgi:hypothetical protein
VFVVGTTIAVIVSLLVCSGNNKVSTKDAFTLFENYSGWTNSKLFIIICHYSVYDFPRWLGIFVGIHITYVDAYRL